MIALDGDAAGNAAVARLAQHVEAAGATRVRRAAPRHGKDWNEELIKVENDR